MRGSVWGIIDSVPIAIPTLPSPSSGHMIESSTAQSGKLMVRTAVVLGVCATALRLIQIGQEAFWGDEVLTLRALRNGVMPHILGSEGTPPFSFYLIKLWSLVFGQSHEALRGFSALAGGLSIPALYLCARRWGLSNGAALAAAAMLMFNPMAYWFSQQNRYNALLMLLGILWLASARALFGPARTGRPQIWFALVGFANFATHYYFAFYAVGMTVAFCAWWMLHGRDMRILRRFIVSNLLMAGLMLTLAPIAFRQLGNSPVDWLPPPTFGKLIQVYRDMYWIGPWARPDPWRTAIVAFAVMATLGGFAWGASRRLRHELKPGSGDVSERPARFALVFFVLAFVPNLVTYVISIAGYPIFLGDRYTLPFLAPFLLWIASGWDRWPERFGLPLLPLATAGVAVVGLISMIGYWDRLQGFDWRAAVQHVQRDWREGDAMVFCPDWMGSTFAANGGQPRGVLSSNDLDRIQAAQRVWLIMWEFAPESDGRHALQDLRDQTGGTVLISQIITTLSVFTPTGLDPNRPRIYGFYNEEDWGGVRVKWSRPRSSFAVVPEAEELTLQYWVGHPDVSPERPVLVTVGLDGRQVHLARHEAKGLFTATVSMIKDYGDGDGAVEISIQVDPGWTSPGGRELGIGLYPLVWATERN